MSLKCTVLHGKNYHFYWDYATHSYGIDFKHKKTRVEYSHEGFLEFLKRVGESLEQCNRSDAGIYMWNLKSGKVNKFKVQKYKGCCQHGCCKKKK